MLKIHVSNIKEAKAYITNNNRPKESILFMNFNDLPIGAWSPDGRSGGQLYTRRSIKSQREPSHRYGGSADAYDFLLKNCT